MSTARGDWGVFLVGGAIYPATGRKLACMAEGIQIVLFPMFLLSGVLNFRPFFPPESI